MGEFATLLKSYGANVWPVEAFAKVGITYEQNAEPKSTLYTNMLPLLNSCRVFSDGPEFVLTATA